MSNDDKIFDKPKFLPKKPLGCDLFEGKAQEKIANSIKEEIENNSDIKMIGLEGEWGSGKSNVIELLKQKLQFSNCLFFIYDIWGHQEDLQRKSILDELISFLIEKKVINKKWEKKKKELSGTIVEHKSKSIPSFSLGFIFAFFIVCLTPLCGVIAENKKDVLTLWQTVLIYSAPVILLSGLYILSIIWSIITICRCNQRKWYEYIFVDSLYKIISFYKDKEIESSTVEFQHETNPSVAEFISFMNALSHELGTNQLVIVFDNMDRLPSDKVREIWSSIHTFFAETNYSNIYTIITFDREQIKIAFTNDDSKKSVGNDFINKTFDLVYRVSLPVLSDWKNYFDEQWKESFGTNIDTKELNYVKIIFESFQKNITPRSIVTFINDIAAVTIISENKIQKRYIALWVEVKDKILSSPDIVIELINKHYLGNMNYLFNDDIKLEENIASLVYQIDPEKVMSVVYVKPLQDALNSNDRNRLISIKKSSIFYDVIDQAIANVTNVENAILGLNNLSDVGIEQREHELWDNLYEKAKTIEEFAKPNSHEVTKPQEILFRNITKKVEYLKYYLLNDFKKIESLDISKYWNKLKKLLELSDESSIDMYSLIEDKEVTSQKYLEFYKSAKDLGVNFNLSTNLEKLDSFLCNIKPEELSSYLHIEYIAERPKLRKFKEKLESYLPTLNSEEILFSILDILSFITNEKIVIDSLSKNTLVTVGNNIQKSNQNFAHFCALRFAYNPLIQLNTLACDTILQTEDDLLAEQIFKYINRYLSMCAILCNLSLYIYPVYKKICNLEVIKTDNHNADINKILNNCVQICTKGNIPFDLLLNRMNNWNQYVKEELLDITKLMNVNFIESCNKTKNDLSINCLTILHSNFDKYTIEQWITKFTKLKEVGIQEVLCSNYKWSNNAFEAVTKVLKTHGFNGELSMDKNLWDKIISSFNAQRKYLSGTFKEIRDEYTSGRVRMTVDKFLVWGDWFFTYSELEENKASARTILIPDLLNNEKTLSLILNYPNQIKKLIYDDNIEATDFIIHFRTLLKQNNDENIIKLNEILNPNEVIEK